MAAAEMEQERKAQERKGKAQDSAAEATAAERADSLMGTAIAAVSCRSRPGSRRFPFRSRRFRSRSRRFRKLSCQAAA